MIQMLDTIDARVLPSGSFAYAGYIDGKWQTYNTIKEKFPGADVMSIAVFASDDADCLDIEQLDATPDQAAAWVLRQYARGIKRPCLYASASVMDTVISAIKASGIDRYSVRLWSAHYGSGQHICGPSSCGLMSVAADGTQWTDTFGNLSIDQSLLNDYFFDNVQPWQVSMMTQLPYLKLNNTDSTYPWFIHRVQAILNDVYGYTMKVDGVFGTVTETAVMSIQKRYGLIQDGIVGPDTWKALYTGSV